MKVTQPFIKMQYHASRWKCVFEDISHIIDKVKQL